MSTQEEIQKLKERIAYLEGQIAGLTQRTVPYIPTYPLTYPNTAPTWGGMPTVTC